MAGRVGYLSWGGGSLLVSIHRYGKPIVELESIIKAYKPLMIVLVAVYLQGCAVASTYVSTIGLRDRYTTIEKDHLRESSTVVYEHKLKPYGGGHAMLFIPYKSIAPDQEKTVIGSQPFQEGDRPDYVRYRKWHGYPAQALQVTALPADIVVATSVGVGMIIWYPVSLLID